jgi:hypothetical protein
VTAGAAAEQPSRARPPRAGAGTGAGDRTASARPTDAAARSRADAAAGTGDALRSPVDRRQLDREAAERVLRRTVELDGIDDGVDHRVSVQALLDAADELGIDRAEVRRAVVEEELGLLDRPARWTDALLGPDRFVVARVLIGTADEVAERVDAWMRRGRVLRRSRSTRTGDGPGWVEYARRTDPVAAAQRAARAVRGGERLAHVRRVRVVVTELDERRCVVGLLVDASRSRRNAAAGGTAVSVTGTAASLVALAPPWGVAGAVGGVAASVAAGAGVMWARKAYTSEVDEELESVLDAVASGERPPSVIEGVTSRLLRTSRP